MSSLLNGLFPSLLGNPPLQRLASRDLPFYSAALLPKPPSEREARLPARLTRQQGQADQQGQQQRDKFFQHWDHPLSLN